MSPNSNASPTKRAASRRIRRKCSSPNCPNRVVQGGVCVAHGAKRKLCLQPNCDKAVKLAGYCSAHGPARRRCDEPSCSRVAVQGGRCLSHGARRRVCKFPDQSCDKNAIMGGMCKKHHDLMKDANGLLDSLGICGVVAGETKMMEVADPVAESSAVVPPASRPVAPIHSPLVKTKPKQSSHRRGLSIFEEMQTVDAIINSGAGNQQIIPPVVVHSAPDVAASVMPPPPPAPRPIPVESLPSTTPAPQVSFADAPKPSLEEYYSPTIAIFEQMIKASEVIDNPSKGYAGLSPPKLTPRGRRVVSFRDEPREQIRIAAAPPDWLQRTVSHDEEPHVRAASPPNVSSMTCASAPETPDLNHEPLNIVSAGSHQGGIQEAAGTMAGLLPQRRNEYEHLFIPRALS